MGKNLREFLRRVLPWPGDDGQGFINAHAMMRNNDGSKPWTGTPTRDVDQFLQVVHTMLGWTNPPEIYMCMSRQAQTKLNKDGKVRAAKSQEHALALKSIYLDIDVKTPPKGYASITEVIVALHNFCQDTKIPKPTALVMSGGGVHAHWISDRALTPDEWQPYADGLKSAAISAGLRCDYGVTGDSARVLRVPGTFNYKQDPPRPVKLLGLNDKDYDFARDLAVLPTIAPALPRPANPTLAGRPAAAFASTPVESLAEGIGREQLPPLDPTPLVKECGWFKEALTTGGRDFSQGLWNLTTLAATFMEHGNGLAHGMARGHLEYSHGTTEALWERKVAERASHGLGWPSCRAIQAEGCGHCAACPHLAAHKSPLNLCRVPSPNRVGPMASGTPVAPYVAPSMAGTPLSPVTGLVPVTTSDLPDGFVVLNDIICKTVDVKIKGQPPSTEYWPVFHCSLYTPWACAGPDALNFTVSVDKGSFHDVSIPLSKMTTIELERELLNGRVKPVADSQKYMKGFIMSWLAKLHAAAAAQTSSPFGWHMDGNTCMGFSYGSVLYKADGTRGPVGRIDPLLKQMYIPAGDVQPWMDAFQMILDQKRPGLETIVAAALGSPLMRSSGEYVGLFSVWGDTGAGKSTAMRVALAVWGNPKLAKENEGATEKSVLNRLGQIKNLPYMWDEIKDDKAREKVHTLLFRSGGKDNSRLDSNIQQRKPGDWENIIGIASNKSFGDYVLRVNPDTAAGLVRLFEWHETKPVKGALGQRRSGDVGRMIRALDDNYGEIGKQWSMFLGTNYDLCHQHVVNNSHWFEDAVKNPDSDSQEERFWVALCAAIQSGAELANEHLGLNFDLTALRAFLVEKYMEQRKDAREDQAEGGSYDWTEGLLTAFIKAYHRCTLRTTKGSIAKRGLPPVTEILTPFPEKNFPVHIHWILDPGILLISHRELNTWLKTQQSEARTMKLGLRNHFGAKFAKGTLGAGTTYKEPNEPLVIIQVEKDSALWHYMMQTTPPEPAAARGAIDTAAVTSDTAGLFANKDAPGVAPGTIVTGMD